MTPDDMTQDWEARAKRMRGRPLTAEEKAALGEEVLKGKLHPGLDSRKRKRAIRRAVDSVRPAGKTRTN